MTDSELETVARRQLADYDRQTPGMVFAEEPPGWDLDDAYRVQLAVVALRQRRGETVAGFKIGCVSEVIRKQLGITHAVIGHVFAGEIRETGVVLDSSEFDQLAIEGEFGVRIAEDIPDAESVAAGPERYVASVFPVIELHNARLRAGRQSAVELVANNAIHAGIVMATECEPRREVRLTVSINGELRGVDRTDPTATLPELVERLAGVGLKLKKGQVALTGSPLPLYPLSPGDEVLVEAEGMASVGLSVAL